MSSVVLAQSASVSTMLVWIVILIVFVLIGGVVIFALRRRMLSNEEGASVGSSGLLDHLHQMHRAGEIDDEEFARARSAILMKIQDDMQSNNTDSATTES